MVSVGNLSVGGTGKTPLVSLVARVLVAGGHHPCILTRGYGRHRGSGPIFLEPASGRVADARQVGDEPAALATELPNVLIVVSADRWSAGRIAEQRFPVSVHLLDDGFQHLSLYRDLDIVLLDVTRPSSELALLPAGRWREPFSALRRAQWVVLTRSELGDVGVWQAQVEAVHPRARIFRLLNPVRRAGGRADRLAGTS